MNKMQQIGNYPVFSHANSLTNDNTGQSQVYSGTNGIINLNSGAAGTTGRKATIGEHNEIFTGRTIQVSTSRLVAKGRYIQRVPNNPRQPFLFHMSGRLEQLLTTSPNGASVVAYTGFTPTVWKAGDTGIGGNSAGDARVDGARPMSNVTMHPFAISGAQVYEIDVTIVIEPSPDDDDKEFEAGFILVNPSGSGAWNPRLIGHFSARPHLRSPDTYDYDRMN